MNGAIWRLFLLLLVLLPLPFGSYRPLAWSVEGLAVAGLVTASTVRMLVRRERPFWPAALWPPLALLMLVVGWVLVQSSWTAPAGIAHPLWRQAGAVLRMPLRPRISIAPEDGLVLLLRLLTASGIFWLALQHGRERARAFELLRWLGIAAAACALYGLIDYIAGNAYLLWYPRWAYARDVTGTFVNRNTYATSAGIGLIALTATFASRFQEAWRRGDATLSWLGRRSAALAGAPFALLPMALVVAMALLQSHSRMGVMSSIAGLIVLLALMRTIGLAGRGWLLAVPALAAAVFSFSGADVIERLGTGDLGSRPALAATTARIIASAPLLGSGYGAFASALPMYRDMTLPDASDYLMAHDSYLETMAELGIPAALALMLAIAWLVILCGGGVATRRRDRIVPAAALAAAVLVGVHALLDFSIQIPAVQYQFAALLGIGVAQSFRQAAAAGDASG